MLCVIVGHAEISLESLPEFHPSRIDLENILNAAHQSADLIMQLLSFAQKQTIFPQLLNLNETIECTLKRIRSLNDENIELDWKPRTDLWKVKIDATQMDQILTNLYLNALDAIHFADYEELFDIGLECVVLEL